MPQSAVWFLQSLVGVNYDMTDYLPDESHSTISLELMQEEFEGGIPNARVMVKNVSIPEALEYKEKLLACEGVTEVLWLDDVADIYQPLTSLDEDTVNLYYKDKAALFTVTVDENKRIEAVDAIRIAVGNENAISGNAVSTAIATTSTISEITKIAIFAVLFIFLVLFITTPSWLEPIVVMLGLALQLRLTPAAILFLVKYLCYQCSRKHFANSGFS